MDPDVYDLAGQSGAVMDGTEPPGQSIPDGTEPSVSDQGETKPDGAYPQTHAALRTAAYNGEFPDERLPMPDRIYFWALRDMYARYKAGRITKEQGEAEVAAARRVYMRDYAKHNDYITQTRHTATLFKNIEAAASAYAKSAGRTPEADALYEAVYNSRPKGSI